ncbi:biotin/lipoate--protein ligase family protein [Litorisediminicola beolgyonensis]|uniref:Biotin/lipoate--protein ligase family protein n=1 Tax=Litorisediminicola beolgyonensis TaxID=1173614 RepID=A0ABW3ZKL1_9RHOB
MTERPSFPPLLTGVAVPGDAPRAAAIAAARDGCDAGTIFYDPSAPDLAAAIVLAPDVALAQAAQMLPLLAVGCQNALGAIAPPEVGMHLGWDGTLRVNGGRAGRVALVAPTPEPKHVPDWLIGVLELRFEIDLDRGGDRPEETALRAEGCGDLAPLDLLEAWARHSLNWLHRWEVDGPAELHREWTALSDEIGKELAVAGRSGTALGLDEELGLLLKTADGTELVPLTALLETP